MEPVKFDPPKDNFLQKVSDLCTKHGVVFILDEMISGFKWSIKGAQDYFGVRPDLSTWGKGIANGFSCCALTGRPTSWNWAAFAVREPRRFFSSPRRMARKRRASPRLIASIDAFEREGMIRVELGPRRRPASTPR